MHDKHIFAFYYPALSDAMGKEDFSVKDLALVHRMHAVLRLQPQDTVILFDGDYEVEVTIEAISKKEVSVTLNAAKKIVSLKPAITVLLPFLKKDALKEALYSCVELGATSIQMIKTAKMHKTVLNMDHLHALMIAAAEQAKNFALPTLHDAITLEAAVGGTKNIIFFDKEGIPFFDLVRQLKNESPSAISIMIGPEGDLNTDEKQLLRHHQTIFCSLTPTVLRAQQALVVGLGALRSMNS